MAELEQHSVSMGEAYDIVLADASQYRATAISALNDSNALTSRVQTLEVSDGFFKYTSFDTKTRILTLRCCGG